MSKAKTTIGLIFLLICVFTNSGICGNTDALTFFEWSDQHVKTDGDDIYLVPAVDFMNTLPQMDYPADNPKKILNTRIKESERISSTSLSNRDNDDTAVSYSLFLDTHFREGFLLSCPDSKKSFASEAVLNFDNLNNKPVWRLCQWGTKHSLAKARCIHHTNGDLSYGNEAKRVLVGAANSDNKDLVLEINGSAEYENKARKYGESWPHLLVEQQVSKVYPLDKLVRLDFLLKIKLLYSENRMAKEAYDSALHAAQFQMFLVVKNVNRQSKDFRDYYWFGVPFYDSRYDIPPSYKAKDAGKADATGKFIYTIAGKQVNNEPLKPNEWRDIDADLLPHIKEGLKEAVERGYFESSNPDDYAVAAMNMGWELPGTFDVSVQIQDFDVLAILR